MKNDDSLIHLKLECTLYIPNDKLELLRSILRECATGEWARVFSHPNERYLVIDSVPVTALISDAKRAEIDAELTRGIDHMLRRESFESTISHPEMAEVCRGIFVGGWSAARDRYFNFNEIVNVAVDAPTFGKHHFPLVDGPGNDQAVMDAAVDCVTYLLRIPNKRILVHCVSGRSRSATVLAKAMENALGIPFSDTIKRIQELRQSPNPEKQPHHALVEMVQKKGEPHE